MSLNQSKVAALIGVTRPEINKILNGKRNLTEGMIARIVARTGVSESRLRNNEGGRLASAALIREKNLRRLANWIKIGRKTAKIGILGG